MKSPRLNSEVPVRMTTTHFIQQVIGLFVGHVFADASSSCTSPPLKTIQGFYNTNSCLSFLPHFFLFSPLHPFCPNYVKEAHSLGCQE